MRALFKDNSKEFPLKPLDKGDAEKLEIRSRDYKDTFEIAAKDKNRLSSTGSASAKPDWKWNLILIIPLNFNTILLVFN